MVPNKKVVLSGDNFRLAIGGTRYNEYIEPQVKYCLRSAARALLLSGYDVLIDDTNTTWDSIRELLKLDPAATPIWHPNNSCFYKFAIPSPQFSTHVEECKERARNLNQVDLCVVIDRMASNLAEMWCTFKARLEKEREKAKKAVWKIV